MLASFVVIEPINDVQQTFVALRDRGWTLAAIADEVGVSRRTVYRWLSGESYPQRAKAVMVALDHLMKGRGIPKRRYVKGSRRQRT